MPDTKQPERSEVIDGTSWGLPLPVPDDVSAPFFASCLDGVLTVQRCEACGHRQHYPRAWCTVCGGETGWEVCSGTGTVYSFTVIRQMRQKPFGGRTPYVVALVDLDEGPRMMGNILDAEPAAVTIGARVGVTMVKVSAEVALPMWRLAT